MSVDQITTAPVLPQQENLETPPKAVPEYRSEQSGFWASEVMAMASTSDPSVESLKRWRRYFSQGTTTVIDWSISADEPQFLRAEELNTTPNQLIDLLRFFWLSNTQLMAIFRVSNDTINDWYRGRSDPSPANKDRLRKIHELALLVPQLTHHYIRESFLEQPIIGEKSFFDLLRESKLDMPRLREVVIALVEKSVLVGQQKEMEEEDRVRHGFTKLTPEQEARNLADNLDWFCR